MCGLGRSIFLRTNIVWIKWKSLVLLSYHRKCCACPSDHEIPVVIGSQKLCTNNEIISQTIAQKMFFLRQIFSSCVLGIGVRWAPLLSDSWCEGIKEEPQSVKKKIKNESQQNTVAADS